MNINYERKVNEEMDFTEVNPFFCDGAEDESLSSIEGFTEEVLIDFIKDEIKDAAAYSLQAEACEDTEMMAILSPPIINSRE